MKFKSKVNGGREERAGCGMAPSPCNSRPEQPGLYEEFCKGDFLNINVESGCGEKDDVPREEMWIKNSS